ncbi:MAG: ATP-binding protein [Chlamydiae bacterium]|nr:ATP-binding protein [Chlamydiota bacterium]
MIDRAFLAESVLDSLRHYPVTLLLGPRQCGKTTLAKAIYQSQKGNYFDLEDPDHPLKPDIAKLALEGLKGLVVIDEFQREPSLFPLLRVLADRKPLSTRFLILGSASPDLVRGVSESLAGRVAYIEMGGFLFTEVRGHPLETLWLRGSFPNSFLAKTEEQSFSWRLNFIQSFLEKDIPQLGIRIPSSALRQFWTMMAHFHGQIWNASDLGRSLGTQESTAHRYLDILTGAFMIRQLHPWFENVGKRLVKAPKIYLRDSGLLHALLGLKRKREVQSHPKLGFSWEGFALEEIIRLTRAEKDAYYYKTHAGTELDLFLIRNGKRYGFEFKYGDAPSLTKSMAIAFEDLKLDRMAVIYPGTKSYLLREKIEVIPLQECMKFLRKNKLYSK